MMKNNQYKKNCISHVITRFGERFKKEDFVCEYNVKGTIDVVDFTDQIVEKIVNAPKAGKSVKGGKAHRNIFKIKVWNTKPVFVVWDMKFSIPVTVLTAEMWSKVYG